ncbi:hypothetical protein SAMN05444161_9384 [Rhizobiales bacterium GAS191]|nr:hypothetical protein SAMN05444161_9384 [Rhizobiales bacterium GAS191]
MIDCTGLPYSRAAFEELTAQLNKIVGVAS